MSASKETLGRTIGIVVAVCLVCSIVVSTAAVGLREKQQINQQIDKQTNILDAAGLLEGAAGDVQGTYNKYIEERYIELATGKYVEVASGFDMFKAAKDPEYQVIPAPDIASVFRHSKVVNVYHVKDENGALQRLVLPVYGSGLWGMMYGFLALDGDGNTVRNLVYYEHKETPGLGGEVQNPAWKAQWNGKQLFKGEEIAIELSKTATADDKYAVDALSGATLTSNGVENTLKFWLSKQGFGAYLSQQPWKA